MHSYHPSWSQGYDPEQFSAFYHHSVSNAHGPPAYNSSGFHPNFPAAGVQPYHVDPPRSNFPRPHKFHHAPRPPMLQGIAPVPPVGVPAPVPPVGAKPLPPPPPPPPRMKFPFKKFVKSSGMVDSSEDGPEFQGVRDIADFNQIIVQYNVIENTSEISAQSFAVVLTIGDEVYYGAGGDLKSAKLNAAQKVKGITKYIIPPPTVTMKLRPQNESSTQILYNLASKKGFTPVFKFNHPPNFELNTQRKRRWAKVDIKGHYEVVLTINDRTFFGDGDFPQTAKHRASQQAMEYVTSLPDIADSHGPKLDSVSATVMPGGKQVVMVLNEIAMKRGICMEWEQVQESGPPHLKSFEWSLTFGDRRSLGSAPTKKLAKAAAAAFMYESIPEDWKTTVNKKKKSNKRSADNATNDLLPTKIAKAEPTAPSNPPLTEPENPAVLAPASCSAPVPDPTPVPLPVISYPHPPKKPIGKVEDVVGSKNPISAVYEYCKKVRLPDPVFEALPDPPGFANSKIAKKLYTVKLFVAGDVFEASEPTKKAAKTAAAAQAWEKIRDMQI